MTGKNRVLQYKQRVETVLSCLQDHQNDTAALMNMWQGWHPHKEQPSMSNEQRIIDITRAAMERYYIHE